jgi:hypothetical protein
VSIPARLLEPDEYLITLQAPQGGELADVATYAFRVDEPR